ncbi:MAG: hypothetical protein Q9213_007141 [Squamulea squamosa]
MSTQAEAQPFNDFVYLIYYSIEGGTRRDPNIPNNPNTPLQRGFRNRKSAITWCEAKVRKPHEADNTQYIVREGLDVINNQQENACCVIEKRELNRESPHDRYYDTLVGPSGGLADTIKPLIARRRKKQASGRALHNEKFQNLLQYMDDTATGTDARPDKLAGRTADPNVSLISYYFNRGIPSALSDV